MTIGVSYMGTKRVIAPVVADIAADCAPGPFLDLFAGICTVAEKIAPHREVWCNDVQHFASTVAASFFTSNHLPPDTGVISRLAEPYYSHNLHTLTDRFESELKLEECNLEVADHGRLREFYTNIEQVGNNPTLGEESALLRLEPRAFPMRLFALTFAGGYLGIKQCLQVDSIRYAIHCLSKSGVIEPDVWRWLILALCEAVCKAATTTGHFAQFQEINERNAVRFLKQRTKDIHAGWMQALSRMLPAGSPASRNSNRFYRSEAVALLRLLADEGARPSVIYADPPYTDDQYSRYYHLYETLILYDYPSTTGKGRYRNDRYSSQFSQIGGVGVAFANLIEGARQLDADLIISYPLKGVLPSPMQNIPKMMEKHYNTVNIVKVIDNMHSSLGASHGSEKRPAKEMLIHARC